MPLKFDENTARFEPLKFASVQVMLSYSSPRPDFIWVPVEDEFGISELVKVTFVYPQLPYSCSHCKAFGHSFSRCVNNPNATKPAARPRPHANNQAPSKAQKKNTQAQDSDPVASIEANVDIHKGNDEVNPMIVDDFIGCDVVLDPD